MGHEHESDKDSGRRSRTNIVFCVFLVIAAFFLITGHRAHLSGWFPYWPYLLLLACPLMHLPITANTPAFFPGFGAKVRA